MTRIAHKTRLEGDSTTALDVPASVDLPAGYLDGMYVTVPTLKHRFPGKRIVAGTVNGSTSGADFIDCEAGDAKPPTAARYVKTERRKHHWPTIYFPLSDIAAVCRELKALGLGPDVPLWTAHYTGVAHICDADCLKPYGPLPFTPLIIATQYATPGIGVSGHFDLSMVADYWPGVDPKPQPKPHPATPTALWHPTVEAIHTVITNLDNRHTPTDAAGDHLLDALVTAAQRVRRLSR